MCISEGKEQERHQLFQLLETQNWISCPVSCLVLLLVLIMFCLVGLGGKIQMLLTKQNKTKPLWTKFKQQEQL